MFLDENTDATLSDRYFCRKTKSMAVSIFAKNILQKKPKRNRLNTVKARVKRNGTSKMNVPLLSRFERVWASMAPIRVARRRNFRYVFADQWGDKVWDGTGYVTERERIAKRTGGVALQNNHLFKVVNAIAGVYIKSEAKPICFARQENADIKSQMMTNALQTNYDNNEEKAIMLNEMYELVCGGMPVVCEEWSTHNGEPDAYTYPINPDYFVFESKGNDPRLEWDCSMVGDIRDYTVGELLAEISQYTDDYDYETLTNMFRVGEDEDLGSIRNMQDEGMNFRCAPQNLCRTYRIWTLEYKTRYRVHDPLDRKQPLYKIEESDLDKIKLINQQRMEQALAADIDTEDLQDILINYGQFPDEEGNRIRNLGKIVDQFWHFQLLTPEGEVLVEYDSPYKHKSHPYVFTAHHYINGSVFPFISVVVDQQRYINRLITLHDLAINASVKGVKMIPKSVLGDMSPKEFARQFTEIGGFIFYDDDPSYPGVKPEVITTNSTNIGTSELLKLEIDFINDITAVSGALQGRQANSGTPAALYSMQMQNSTTSISAIFDRFNQFETNLARKKMEVIHQYYKDPRNISIKHSNGYADYGMYEPTEVEDVKFAVKVEQSADTPVARMAMNELVDRMWQAGAINAKQMLKFGYFPGSQGILQELDAMEEAQKAQAISSEAMERVNSQANPQTVEAVRSALAS